MRKIKGKIGLIASKDHDIRKIPSNFRRSVKYNRKNTNYWDIAFRHIWRRRRRFRRLGLKSLLPNRRWASFPRRGSRCRARKPSPGPSRQASYCSARRRWCPRSATRSPLLQSSRCWCCSRRHRPEEPSVTCRAAPATDHPQLDLDLSMSIGSRRHRGDRRRSPMRTGERRRMVHEAGHPCCALLP